MPADKTPPNRRPWMLFAAPHRAMFFAGTVLLLLSFVHWSLALLARAGAFGALELPLPAGWVHGITLTSGVLPLFMFGFLLTAMPRWQGHPEIPRQRWLPAWIALVLGWTLWFAGLFLPALLPALLPLGLGVVLLGWLLLLPTFRGIAFHANRRNPHADIVLGALVVGGLAILIGVLALAGKQLHWLPVMFQIAIWGSLLPIFITVSHRMIPFFTQGVSFGYEMTRPTSALWLLVGCSLAHGALQLAELPRWTWLVDLPAAATALWLGYAWSRKAKLSIRLLAMLHIGFAWLGVGLLLLGLQSLAALAGWTLGALAPLHILLIGYFGSLLFAMVSRVTLGHSGGPLLADRWTWVGFLALQAVVLTRVLVDFTPGPIANTLAAVAALAWLGVFALWALHYLPIYWRPRSDGKPG